MENNFENNIFKLLNTISQLREKNINYQSLNYDLGFFKHEINNKVNSLLYLIEGVNEKFQKDLAEKVKILNNGIEISSNNTNKERATSNIKTDNLKNSYIQNENELVEEFKALEKKEEELLRENYSHYQQEYVNKLKTLTTEKQLISKNHQQSIDFTIEKFQNKKQTYRDQYQSRIEKVRETYQNFLEDNKKEEQTFIPLKNDFYQELNSQTNDSLQSIKNIQEEINQKINNLNIEYNNKEKIKEEELKQEFATLTELKKKLLQNKISKNEELELPELIEINNLETEILIKQFTYKEDIIKAKIRNLPVAYSLYKKYQLLSYTNKRNLVVLEKTNFLKELDNNENFFVMQQNANKKLLELKRDSETLYFDNSIDHEKADIEYKLKKNSAELQNELQLAEISKKIKLEQNRIYTEIERLRFIFKKIDDKFHLEESKNYRNNTLKKKQYSYSIYKKKADINNKITHAELQQKDIKAIINSNLLLNKNYQAYKEKYISEVFVEINTIELYIQTISSQLLEYITKIFKMVPVLFDNCYYMDDKFLDYVNVIKNETEPFINMIKQISKTTDHLFKVVNNHILNYSSNDMKHFKIHSEAQMQRVNDRINELQEKEKIEDNENMLQINSLNNEIRKRKRYLASYLSQIRKLRKIKEKEAQETKIKYFFGFKKSLLDYVFLRKERNNLYQKQKNDLKHFAQNDALKESLKLKVENYLSIIKKTIFAFLKTNNKNGAMIENRTNVFSKHLDDTYSLICDSVKKIKSDPTDRQNIQKSVGVITKYFHSFSKQSKKYFAAQFSGIKNIYHGYLKLVKLNTIKEVHYNKIFEKKELSLINYQLYSFKQNIKILDKLDRDYNEQMDRNFSLEKKNKNMHQELERKILNKNIKLLRNDIKSTKAQENNELQILKANISELQSRYLNDYKRIIKESNSIYNNKQNQIASITDKCNSQLKLLETEHDIKYVKLYKNYLEQKNSLVISYQKDQEDIINLLQNIYRDFKDKVKTDAVLLSRELQNDTNKIKQMKKLLSTK